MTVLERKKRFVQSVMNEPDEVFIELEKAYKKISKREPCMYTVEELRKSLKETEKEFAEGKGIPHDEVMAKYGL